MANSEAVAEQASAPTGRIAPFGKYLLLQRVSVGGMAEVFKALPQGAERIDQIVAVKRILPNIAEDNEFIGMFIDEARIAGQLTHPNICRIYELGRVGGDHYIAMQFLWGRDLLKVMNRFKKAGQAVPPPMAAFIAAKACAALHYAHTKTDATGQPLHIIHRDVSPQNIIVGYSGQVKLIDFGVARAASQSQKTQAGILKGKFGYMSPEMIRGLPVDHRSDVFAMGICLHEALTGSRLFYGETDFATLELVRDANIAPPSAKVPGIPAALDAIVLKALARDAEDRFGTAADMEAALEELLVTHYGSYGEPDVGAMMRQAFAFEVTREKQRLEVFSDMLARGELVRGAAVPALPSEPPPSSGERSAAAASPFAGLHEQATRRGDATLGGSLLPPSFAAIDEGAELADEQTQIFFSAEELDEIREIASEPRGTAPEPQPRQPAISDVIMRGGVWSPSHVHTDSAPHSPVTSSGTFHKVVPGSARSAAREPTGRMRDERRIPTMTMKAFDPAEHASVEAEAPARGSLLRTVALAVVAVLLVVGGYLAARMAQPRTGTLEIAAVGDPDALVRVDGVVRGNPPLTVDDLAPGIHDLEVDAKGYELARRKVRVGAGEVTPVSLVLERSVPKPQVAQFGPVVEPRQAEPTTEPIAPAAKAEEEREHHGARKSTRTAEKAQAATLAPTPAEPAPPVAEPAPAVSASAAEPAPAASDGMGELLISTLPWSHVFVDEDDTGRDTPVRSLRVPEGAHRIGLRTPDGVVHYVDVFVEAGQTVRIIRRF